MRMSMGLQARQMQVQKLAPRMIQSMEILQMPTLALQERIDQELSENPLLEQQELDALPGDEFSEDGNSADTRSDDEKELVVKEDNDNRDDFERLTNSENDLP